MITRHVLTIVVEVDEDVRRDYADDRPEWEGNPAEWSVEAWANAIASEIASAIAFGHLQLQADRSE